MPCTTFLECSQCIYFIFVRKEHGLHPQPLVPTYWAPRYTSTHSDTLQPFPVYLILHLSSALFFFWDLVAPQQRLCLSLFSFCLWDSILYNHWERGRYIPSRKWKQKKNPNFYNKSSSQWNEQTFSQSLHFFAFALQFLNDTLIRTTCRPLPLYSPDPFQSSSPSHCTFSKH